MALKASYEFLFFGRDDNSFLENYYYDLFQDLGEKSGQIFINLEVQNNPADAEEIGGVIFETMQKVFFSSPEKDPYERFEMSLKEVNRILSEFKGEKFSGYIGNLNVIIAVVVGGTLYLSQSGDSEAYLIRKRYISVISEGLADESGSGDEVFSSIASGNLEEGDFVLFTSTRLLRYIGKSDLAKCVTKKGVQETLESIRDTVSTEILGRVGFTGVYFETVSEAEVVEEEDHMTRSMLESDESKTSGRRESLTGRFFTSFKGFRRGKRDEVFQGGGGRSRFFELVSEWFSSFWKGVFSKGFGKDKILFALILVIIVLTVGIWFAKSNSATRAELEQLDEVLQSVQEKISEAETRGTYDKDSAKTILDKAYEDSMMVLNSGFYREKANMYLMQIEDVRDGLDNVERVEDVKVLVDLTSKREDVNALGLVSMKDRLFVFEYNALYEIVLDQVQDPLTIDDEETVIAATDFEDRDSIVFMTKSGKLIEYKGGTMSFLDTDDETFRKGVAIEDWSNRIYVLDAAEGQIWKYTYKGARKKFGTAEPYLLEDEEVDLKSSKDFAIDANLYVLDDKAEIQKFYGGSKVDFFITNAPFNVFKDPSIIYTNEKLDEVYVVDTREMRVLVFLKDANTGNLEYKKQFLFDIEGELRDVYIDPDAKKLYLLTPTKILEMDV